MQGVDSFVEYTYTLPRHLVETIPSLAEKKLIVQRVRVRRTSSINRISLLNVKD